MEINLSFEGCLDFDYKKGLQRNASWNGGNRDVSYQTEKQSCVSKRVL